MAIPSSDKIIGSPGHVADHNSITTELTSLSASLAAATFVQPSGQAFEQARSVTTSEVGVGKVPIGVDGDYVYGYVDNVLYRTDDFDGSWETVEDFDNVTNGSDAISGAFLKLFPTGDGEVLIVKVSGIFKSAGWSTSPLTATFSRVLQPTSPSWFTGFSVDVDTTSGWAAASSYITGADMTNSRYVWLSEDSGGTWAAVFDFETEYAAQDGTVCHMHGVAIDSGWSASTPRLWTSMHDTSSNSFQVVLYSDDAGATWTEFDTTINPTVLCATDQGMVFGTDDSINGVYRVVRTTVAADMTLELAVNLVRDTPSLWGWASTCCKDTDGNVHIPFKSMFAGGATAVASTDGYRADETVTIAASSATAKVDLFTLVAFGGELIGVYLDDELAVNRYVRAALPKRGVRVPDVNGADGGTASAEGVALGYQASAGAEAVAIGQNTVAPLQSVVIGVDATGTTDTNVVIGRTASVTGSQGVAVGKDAAAAAAGVAVGYSTSASGGTAVGNDATASSDLGTAVGRQSVSDSGSVAIGRQADAGHHKGVALGYQQATTAASQVRMGDVHVELVEITDPTAPAANGARLYVRDNGAGKTELVVRFNTGAIQVIATEP